MSDTLRTMKIASKIHGDLWELWGRLTADKYLSSLTNVSMKDEKNTLKNGEKWDTYPTHVCRQQWSVERSEWKHREQSTL